MAFLIVHQERQEHNRCELTGPVTLGRSPECDIVLHDPKVSRRQCRFEPAEDGRWRVVDLESRNGTFLHGEPVTQHTLADGDRIFVGEAVRISFGTGVMPLRRPSDPSEALELVRTAESAAGAEPSSSNSTAAGPMLMPRPWDQPPGSGLPDDHSAASTGLSFGKQLKKNRPERP
ncbi:MAG TPA: FHA domain-containing protein [Tepidisphaeraceae bacterium]|jgi:pSer/pThr/pTyr-binding forkhead associated (FHA) protein